MNQTLEEALITLADSLAWDMIRRMKAAADASPDGETWEIIAQLKGMTAAEYTDAMQALKRAKLVHTLTQLDKEVQEALLLRLAHQPFPHELWPGVMIEPPIDTHLMIGRNDQIE